MDFNITTTKIIKGIVIFFLCASYGMAFAAFTSSNQGNPNGGFGPPPPPPVSSVSSNQGNPNGGFGPPPPAATPSSSIGPLASSLMSSSSRLSFESSNSSFVGGSSAGMSSSYSSLSVPDSPYPIGTSSLASSTSPIAISNSPYYWGQVGIETAHASIFGLYMAAQGLRYLKSQPLFFDYTEPGHAIPPAIPIAFGSALSAIGFSLRANENLLPAVFMVLPGEMFKMAGLVWSARESFDDNARLLYPGADSANYVSDQEPVYRHSSLFSLREMILFGGVTNGLASVSNFVSLFIPSEFWNIGTGVSLFTNAIGYGTVALSAFVKIKSFFGCGHQHSQLANDEMV